MEAAISAYAAEHPTSITIGHLSGYGDVYLTGDWPETITLSALSGDRTVIVIVAENGTTTTYNTDGTVTVTGGASSTDGSSSGSQTGGGTSGGTQTGGDNTGGGGNTGDGPDGD